MEGPGVETDFDRSWWAAQNRAYEEKRRERKERRQERKARIRMRFLRWGRHTSAVTLTDHEDMTKQSERNKKRDMAEL